MQEIRNYADITVVVQGPVQSLADRGQEEGITKKCLNSVRTHLPGAKIILSTWHNQDLTDLSYDELVLCDDPGRNIREYRKDGSAHYFNNNRQIVSSSEGLKRVTTKYAIKLRSDNYLTGNDFVALQQEFPARCSEYKFLQERVVVANTFTRKYAKGHKVAFHLSDFFYFGLTEDLLTLWDLPLIADVVHNNNPQLDSCYPNYLLDCTQLFWLLALQKFSPAITLDHLLDNSSTKLAQSDCCYANNLVIASPEELGLALGEKFSDGKVRVSRDKGICAQIQFSEWQALYKEYCDPNFKVMASNQYKLSLFLKRLRYVYPTYLETKIRLLKRKLRR